MYFLGFFNPCRKGHLFIGNEKEHICSRCGLVESHSYIQDGDHCVCSVCGISTAAHTLVSEGKNLVCVNCGYSIEKIDKLKLYIKENGVLQRGMYCIEDSLKDTTYQIGYYEKDNSLEFYYKSTMFWETTVTVTLYLDTGKCDCSYSEYDNPFTQSFLQGYFSAGSYNIGDKITVTTASGLAADASVKDSFRNLFYSQIGSCLERSQTLLDKLDFEISLHDIGFDQLN